MFEGLAVEVIAIMTYMEKQSGWALFLLFFGGTIIGFLLGITKIITQFIHSFIPDIKYTVVRHYNCSCSCGYEEAQPGFELATKGESPNGG